MAYRPRAKHLRGAKDVVRSDGEPLRRSPAVGPWTLSETTAVRELFAAEDQIKKRSARTDKDKNRPCRKHPAIYSWARGGSKRRFYRRAPSQSEFVSSGAFRKVARVCTSHNFRTAGQPGARELTRKFCRASRSKPRARSAIRFEKYARDPQPYLRRGSERRETVIAIGFALSHDFDLKGPTTLWSVLRMNKRPKTRFASTGPVAAARKTGGRNHPHCPAHTPGLKNAGS